jgi:hypothetical protein
MAYPPPRPGTLRLGETFLTWLAGVSRDEELFGDLAVTSAFRDQAKNPLRIGQSIRVRRSARSWAAAAPGQGANPRSVVNERHGDTIAFVKSPTPRAES